MRTEGNIIELEGNIMGYTLGNIIQVTLQALDISGSTGLSFATIDPALSVGRTTASSSSSGATSSQVQVGGVKVISESSSLAVSADNDSVTVTGGLGKETYLYHEGSLRLTINDFSVEQGDNLVIDRSLQPAMTMTPDGTGGTLLSFGALAGGIDLKGVPEFPATALSIAL